VQASAQRRRGAQRCGGYNDRGVGASARAANARVRRGGGRSRRGPARGLQLHHSVSPFPRRGGPETSRRHVLDGLSTTAV